MQLRVPSHEQPCNLFFVNSHLQHLAPKLTNEVFFYEPGAASEPGSPGNGR